MAVPFLSVAEQAWKIEEDCERAAIRDALVSTRWYKYNLGLGLASAITAAVAGFLAGSGSERIALLSWADSKLLVSFFALASAVLASTLTFLAPAEKANAFQQTSNKYHALREKLRYFINNRCNEDGVNLASELQVFMLEKQEIDADHPILPEWAYKRAHQKVRDKVIRNKELAQLRAGAGDVHSA
ncbi:MAG TPA: SLATT domain-containing protein [Bradyrhizobium sp.]|uniref:SLATT domain-containing protein n=1 Tax=Bradyrhizobium sp. TaxID=376 RepID=UPI002BE16BD4|nr:SLATT domain-containing protein [Bradyrhizobium sp.]HLZ03251.1 SLATT domain-containing protein [Bradyrhizobium sp.]